MSYNKTSVFAHLPSGSWRKEYGSANTASIFTNSSSAAAVAAAAAINHKVPDTVRKVSIPDLLNYDSDNGSPASTSLSVSSFSMDCESDSSITRPSSFETGGYENYTTRSNLKPAQLHLNANDYHKLQHNHDNNNSINKQLYAPVPTLPVKNTPLLLDNATNSLKRKKDTKYLINAKKSHKKGVREFSKNITLTPTLIEIPSLSLPPLRLAKRHHHKSSNKAIKIQERTGAQRPQGRPFTVNIKSKFVLHDNLITSFCYLERRTISKFLEIDYNSLDEAELSKLVASNVNGNSCSGLSATKTENFKDIQLSPTNLSSPTFESSFQPFLTAENKAAASRIIDKSEYKIQHDAKFIPGKMKPLTKSVIFDPPESDVLDENGAENDENLNFYNVLKNCFNNEFFTFIKVIRDNTGKVVKLETIEQPTVNGRIYYTTEWVKKEICYPRYKSNMKIHLTKGKLEKSVILYNDLRMLLWDIDRNTKSLRGKQLFIKCNDS
ncbi:hypothetical protein PACTADRAFT_34047 [Pachysolen tannophilus NRRL Y-2460]|uniref:Uncharacterized protein n=1 Tax=Pachysolen tannophilus NRRL Y-2460 TaxID=669874 RepID=A0A1E4TUQ9_PACTA|nr:hypothetical protein PACTADRAFT_34047 [Pachysolen tannophilus NRRL Y-2460]